MLEKRNSWIEFFLFFSESVRLTIIAFDEAHQLSGGGNWISAALRSNSRGIPFDPGGLVGRGEKPFIISEAAGVGGATA